MTVAEIQKHVEIKSGMFIEGYRDNKVAARYIIFQTSTNELAYMRYDAANSWDMLTNLKHIPYDRIIVYKAPSERCLFYTTDKIFDSNEIKVELTLEDIAKKFNLPVECIRIKD